MSQSPELRAPANIDAIPVEESKLISDFNTIIQTPELQSIFREAVAKREQVRCKGSDRNKTYYREKYAKQLRDVIDILFCEKKPLIYRYEDFPNLTPHSLYLRIAQSREYMLDHLDPDKKYETMCEALCVNHKKGVGIILSIRHDILDENIAKHSTAFMPSPLQEDEISWRDKMDKFLDEAKPGTEFNQKHLALDEDAIRELEIQLHSLSNITYHITSSMIKIVKLT